MQLALPRSGVVEMSTLIHFNNKTNKTFFQDQMKFNLDQLRDAIPIDPMESSFN